MKNVDKSLIKSYIQQLLKEELTKSDKKEIEKIARRQAKLSMITKKEIEKITKTQIEKEIKAALGTSFMGVKGDINKFVSDTAKEESEKWLDDRVAKEKIIDITKAVMKKLYKDLAVSSPHIIDRIKV